MSGVVSNGGTIGQVLTKLTDVLEGSIPELDYDWRDATGEAITVVGRGPTQGLEYDLATKTLWAPLATDKLAGALIEPVPDMQQYARTYDGGDRGGTWVPVAAGGVLVSDTPPATPAAGQLWWNSSTGNLFIYYQDVDTTQFVQINIAAPATTGIPEAPLDGQMYVRQSGAWVVAP